MAKGLAVMMYSLMLYQKMMLLN